SWASRAQEAIVGESNIASPSGWKRAGVGSMVAGRALHFVSSPMSALLPKNGHAESLLLVFAKHQLQKLWITDVTSFGKSVDQLEGSSPVAFQNEASTFTGFGYARPMLIFRNAIITEQRRNFREVCKPRTVVREATKNLFAGPTSGKIGDLIHV